MCYNLTVIAIFDEKENDMSEKKKGFSLAIIGCVFWGLSGNVAQDLFEQAYIGPMWLVGVRLLGAGMN